MYSGGCLSGAHCLRLCQLSQIVDELRWAPSSGQLAAIRGGRTQSYVCLSILNAIDAREKIIYFTRTARLMLGVHSILVFTAYMWGTFSSESSACELNKAALEGCGGDEEGREDSDATTAAFAHQFHQCRHHRSGHPRPPPDHNRRGCPPTCSPQLTAADRETAYHHHYRRTPPLTTASQSTH